MIFCVEDDAGIRELVVYSLNNSGFQAKGFSDSKGLWEELKTQIPKLILLDLMLPGESGIEILKKIREDEALCDVPVIIITARTQEYDKVIGLDSGADDYISKPFGMMELISRIKAVLRRSRPIDRSNHSVYSCMEVSVDEKSHNVTVNDKKIDLTLKEYEILLFLIKNMETVFTRDDILEAVWGDDYYGETRTVDVHIRTLRSKLGEGQGIIKTIRGVGYKIGEDE